MSKNLGIMFADVSGSTRLYETLGDSVAREIVGRAVSIMIDSVYQHGGALVKTIGDEVMATFPSGSQLMEAACSIQRVFNRNAPDHDSTLDPIDIRVGAHWGPVLEESRDIYGDAVNTAARMVNLAKPAQIITTRDLVKVLSVQQQANVRLIDRTMVKGKQESMDIYELICEEQQAELTMMATGLLDKVARPEVPLKLTFQQKTWELNRDNPSVTMGRGLQNDLVVADTAASRIHARIERRRGKYLLVDQSTNGTYITQQGRETVFLHRDELVINGSGAFGLGHPAADFPDLAVLFDLG